MTAHVRRWLDGKAIDALVGLQLGVIGGVLMVVWYVLIAPVLGQPWWTIPNLLASKYYEIRVVKSYPGMATASGAAVQIVFAGLIGAIAGFRAPGQRLAGLG